jgi:hypothetical protein
LPQSISVWHWGVQVHDRKYGNCVREQAHLLIDDDPRVCKSRYHKISYDTMEELWKKGKKKTHRLLASDAFHPSQKRSGSC